MGGYVFLEHVSDALIDAFGVSLEEAFVNAARGLIDTMVDIVTVEEAGVVEKFEVRGRDLESLLYNWLEAVLIRVETGEVVFSSFDVKISRVNKEYRLRGVGRGEMLNLEKHKPKTEVKAVTYHMMRIQEEEGGRVSARFLLDL